MPVQTIEDGTIYYDDAGNENPLVLIHGAGFNLEYWKFMKPMLSDRHRTISLDVRGHGKSNKLERSSSIRRFSEDVYLLLDALKVEKAVIIGHSMGGFISLDLCLNHPEVVERLVLISSAAKSRKKTRLSYELLVILSMFGITSIEKEIKKILRRMLDPELFEEVGGWLIDQFMGRTREDLVRINRSMWSYNVEDRLGDIQVPVLLMDGEKESSEFNLFMHGRIPNSRYVRIEDCGHMLIVEKPEEIGSHILSFLDDINW